MTVGHNTSVYASHACAPRARITRFFRTVGLLIVFAGCDVERSAVEAKGREESVAEAISAIRDADVTLVYVGASDCVFARSPSAQHALRDALAHFDSVATSTGKRFLTVGIALDQIDSLGLLHLRALGRFDYLFPSGAIDNPGQLHVANGYLGLPSVMPQLALVAFDSSAEDRSKVAPRVLFRTEGVHELLRWKDRGWTVPRGGLIQ